jgi:signal peptidase I
MPLWQELPLLLVIAFCLAVLIRSFLLQAFFIPSGSMEKTLLIGDRVLVNKVVYDVRDPHRGEVVVFRGPEAWAPQVTEIGTPGFFTKLGRTIGDLVGVSRPGAKDFIKRVIGVPGDRVACCDAEGRLTVNGRALDEPYIYDNSPLGAPEGDGCRLRNFKEVLVEPGQLFVMGDHRGVSQDSRCQGQVPIENVIGRAFVVVWPSSRWASLSVPPTFEGVPTALAPAGSASGVSAVPSAGSASGVSAVPSAGVAAGVSAGPSSGPSGPVPEPGGIAVAMPIFASALFLARSRRPRSARQRRLRP